MAAHDARRSLSLRRCELKIVQERREERGHLVAEHLCQPDLSLGDTGVDRGLRKSDHIRHRLSLRPQSHVQLGPGRAFA